MVKKEVYKIISNILDEWDPLGVNIPSEGVYFGEYVMYIDKILEKYAKGESIYQYLIHLYRELNDIPNEEGICATRIAATRIVEFLSRVPD